MRTPLFQPTIGRCEHWQVIGFNRDGTQSRICSAYRLDLLLKQYTKDVARMELQGIADCILGSYNKIIVWNIDEGFTGLELPYIKTIKVK